MGKMNRYGSKKIDYVTSHHDPLDVPPERYLTFVMDDGRSIAIDFESLCAFERDIKSAIKIYRDSIDDRGNEP